MSLNIPPAENVDARRVAEITDIEHPELLTPELQAVERARKFLHTDPAAIDSCNVVCNRDGHAVLIQVSLRRALKTLWDFGRPGLD